VVAKTLVMTQTHICRDVRVTRRAYDQPKYVAVSSSDWNVDAVVDIETWLKQFDCKDPNAVPEAILAAYPKRFRTESSNEAGGEQSEPVKSFVTRPPVAPRDIEVGQFLMSESDKGFLWIDGFVLVKVPEPCKKRKRENPYYDPIVGFAKAVYSWAEDSDVTGVLYGTYHPTCVAFVKHKRATIAVVSFGH
jgi:hypothetical protein